MKTYYYFFKEGSKINQIICAVLINVATLAYGMSVGWMSPMTLLLQSNTSPRDEPLTDSVVSWMASSAYLSGILANFLFAVIEEKLGRKFALMTMSFSMVVCWALKLISWDSWAFILARVVIGFSMGPAYVVCPVYTKEISEDSIRGALGTLVILSQTVGNLVMFIIGDYFSYNTILWVCIAVPLFHMIVFLAMPESPSYLVKKGKFDEAARVVGWLRCREVNDRVVQNEIDIIKKELESDGESSKFLFKNLLTDKILFRAFCIAMVITLAREVCGANPVLNFAGYIFDLAKSKSGGLVLTPNQQAMMLGAVQVAGAILSSSIVEKAGRKPLLFFSSLFSGLGMCCLASWFLARTYGVIWPGWVPITSLCVCIFCDAAGLQPISVVLMNEIFSCRYRSTVSAVTMATASGSDFLQLRFFMPIANSVGIHACFYFFGAVCLLHCIYVVMVVPETKMRPLEDIYYNLKTKKEKEEDEKRMKNYTA